MIPMIPNPLSTEHGREALADRHFLFWNWPIACIRLADDEFAQLKKEGGLKYVSKNVMCVSRKKKERKKERW